MTIRELSEEIVDTISLLQYSNRIRQVQEVEQILKDNIPLLAITKDAIPLKDIVMNLDLMKGNHD